MEGARRGLLIVGELLHSVDRMAVLEISRSLQWPCVVDVLSGLKSNNDHQFPCILSSDQILKGGESIWNALKPDLVLQFGGHFTSKVLFQFLEHCRKESSEMDWIAVSPDSSRDDPSFLVGHKLVLSYSTFHASLAQHDGFCSSYDEKYTNLWKTLDHAVLWSLKRSIPRSLPKDALTEPFVAYRVSQMLPEGHGLYLGNGMPIRDMDMFGNAIYAKSQPSHYESFEVGANRGASGIDGVVSTAFGSIVLLIFCLRSLF